MFYMTTTTKPSSRGKQRSNQKSPTVQDNVLASFLGCGRCSFFLVGYRLIHDDFEQAVKENAESPSGTDWLSLTWDHATAQLVHKTYGSRIEADAYHYQGVCRECHRSFLYETALENGQTAVFRIAVQIR
jgi:hypothetical protein